MTARRTCSSGSFPPDRKLAFRGEETLASDVLFRRGEFLIHPGELVESIVGELIDLVEYLRKLEGAGSSETERPALRR